MLYYNSIHVSRQDIEIVHYTTENKTEETEEEDFEKEKLNGKEDSPPPQPAAGEEEEERESRASEPGNAADTETAGVNDNIC